VYKLIYLLTNFQPRRSTPSGYMQQTPGELKLTAVHLNTAWLSGATAWGNIRQKRLRRSRSELFTLFI